MFFLGWYFLTFVTRQNTVFIWLAFVFAYWLNVLLSKREHLKESSLNLVFPVHCGPKHSLALESLTSRFFFPWWNWGGCRSSRIRLRRSIRYARSYSETPQKTQRGVPKDNWIVGNGIQLVHQAEHDMHQIKCHLKCIHIVLILLLVGQSRKTFHQQVVIKLVPKYGTGKSNCVTSDATPQENEVISVNYHSLTAQVWYLIHDKFCFRIK